jgi:hypothetical protein
MEGTEALDLAKQKLYRQRLLRGGVRKVMRALSFMKLSSKNEQYIPSISHDSTDFETTISVSNDYDCQSLIQVHGDQGLEFSSIQTTSIHSNRKEREGLYNTPLSDDISLSSLDYSIDIGSSLPKDALYQLRKDARQNLMSSFLDPDEIVDSDDDLSLSKQSTPRMSRKPNDRSKTNEIRRTRSKRR